MSGVNEKAGGVATHAQHADTVTNTTAENPQPHHTRGEGITAEGAADEMLHVDDKRAAQIKDELESSRQGGWMPITDEEKRLNSRLNWKLDMMVRLRLCASALHATYS